MIKITLILNALREIRLATTSMAPILKVDLIQIFARALLRQRDI